MSKQLFDLSNRVAVVTGGSGVLGSEMCRTLAQAGASVMVLGRNLSKANQVVQSIEADGGIAMAIATDVLDKEALQQASEKIIATYGKIDILINAAGGNHSSATAMPHERTFFDLEEDAMQWVFSLNFLGTILACQVFGESIVKSPHGTIINISSMASFQPLTRVIAYGGAKAAINNFTQWLSVYMNQMHGDHIRVNAIAPGFFISEQNRYLLFDRQSGELSDRGRQIIDHTPMARFGEPEDLSGTLLWLASDAAKFVTGIVVPVDGGFSAYGGV